MTTRRRVVAALTLAAAGLMALQLLRRHGGPEIGPDPTAKVEATQICLHVEGFRSCPYFQRASAAATIAHEIDPTRFRNPIVVGVERTVWDERKVLLSQRIPGASGHSSSPFVYQGCTDVSAADDAAADFTFSFVGGSDDLVDFLAARQP
ncbi:hypothetical protein DFJ73DRAFT_761824 [Zopfochytrium polystomum]|nr:hypothetical protein DFJ73DRAFT_761824 [Zopfochytrium polystomum]